MTDSDVNRNVVSSSFFSTDILAQMFERMTNFGRTLDNVVGRLVLTAACLNASAIIAWLRLGSFGMTISCRAASVLRAIREWSLARVDSSAQISLHYGCLVVHVLPHCSVAAQSRLVHSR